VKRRRNRRTGSSVKPVMVGLLVDSCEEEDGIKTGGGVRRARIDQSN